MIERLKLGKGKIFAGKGTACFRCGAGKCDSAGERMFFVVPDKWLYTKRGNGFIGQRSTTEK